MQYENVSRAVFLDRPNRFVAHVERDGHAETVHVKNTGRNRELLVPGAEVYLSAASNPNRKTRYDLIAVRKQNGVLFNIDSSAPNRVTAEWLQTRGFDIVRPEYRYGESRLDFYMERAGEPWLLEVKGFTLEVDGIGYFPDAPTVRGTRHLTELTRAAQEGYHAGICFVTQMDGVTEVRPNGRTDPEFSTALEKARCAGVHIMALSCHVEPDSIIPLTGREV